MSLPTADDLFRPTSDPSADRSTDPADAPAEAPTRAASSRAARPATVRAVPDAPRAEPIPTSAAASAADRAAAAEARTASGRIRHDEKMTVYVTSGELIDLERARLDLRGHHGLAVDRGRLVREAVALVLADLEEHGADSLLVRRLAGE